MSSLRAMHRSVWVAALLWVVGCNASLPPSPLDAGIDASFDADANVDLATTPAPVPSADCSTSPGPSPSACPALPLIGDPIAPGFFHGYADPSLRKDPNAATLYFAYSWPQTLADGTRAVDLHLAQSGDGGATFAYVGPLYSSQLSMQTASTAYAASNHSSNETIDLVPVPLDGNQTGQTLWLEAHQSYLVAPATGLYDQLEVTAVISLHGLVLSAPSGPSAAPTLLGLATTPEARLGGAATDPSRAVTQNLASAETSTEKCVSWAQPALWYQSGSVYLLLECVEHDDPPQRTHFLFVTARTGTDVTTWKWGYVGELATPAEAAQLGSVESGGDRYDSFTEPEFVGRRNGTLALLLTPSQAAPPTAVEPMVQLGCRAVPVPVLSPGQVVLATQATGELDVIASVTEQDLYSGANEGPAACTYDPSASTGIVMGRKFEQDPALGYDVYPVATGVFP